MQNTNEKALAVTAEVSKAVLGKPEVVLKIMMAILARGHVLIEDIPGVGKTTLAQAFARAMNLTQNRVQFTPDVLPSDIVGFSLYQKETGKFVYHPGAVACNLFLADEINRTSARTQSALLEVMEEGAVTVDGVTRPLPQPFTVLATENPVGSVGTQMLPESQLDRFMVCVVMGYPDAEAEMEILSRQPRHALLDHVQPVMDKNDLLAMQQQVDEVYMSNEIRRYIVELSRATRQDPLGAGAVAPCFAGCGRYGARCRLLGRAQLCGPAGCDRHFCRCRPPPSAPDRTSPNWRRNGGCYPCRGSAHRAAPPPGEPPPWQVRSAAGCCWRCCLP